MPLLNPSEIERQLSHLQHWTHENGEIVRQASFADFIAAMDFVNSVAEQAEKAGHHPDIDIRYNKVRLALVSHDDGGLTQRDFDLAQSIEALLS